MWHIPFPSSACSSIYSSKLEVFSILEKTGRTCIFIYIFWAFKGYFNQQNYNFDNSAKVASPDLLENKVNLK